MLPLKDGPLRTGGQMKHFRLIERDIDVAPMVQEILDHPQVWSLDSSRQNKVSVQRDTEAVLLVGHSDHAMGDRKAREDMPLRYVGRPTSVSALFPATLAFVERLVRRMHGLPGRAVVVRLKPGGQVYRHTDDELYYRLRDRFHIVLKSVAGSRFRCSEEEVRMKEGELWWFESQVPHEAFNDSEEDRVHLIVDVLSPKSLLAFLIRPLRRARR